MSEYEVPFHIQEEIMKRLPVKSLLQFRSVSKAWKSLIGSSEFIAAHSLRRHTQQQHLLVSYEDLIEEYNYVCYIDDDTFPQQRSVAALPLSFKQLKRKKVIGSSHGLLCFYGLVPNCYRTVMVVLWNPSIRKSIVVAVPGSPDGVGFGFCPVTGDHKIVSIEECWDVHEPNPKDIYCCKVMVYTLSSGKWRTLSTNLLTIRCEWDLCSVVVTDGFIYWHDQEHDTIMSFDVTNESFEVIDLPINLPTLYRYVSKIRESLAILQYNENDCDVWMMEHGVQRLFTKLFTINTQNEIIIVGFRKNGVPIVNMNYDDDGWSKLVVYEPNSEYNNVLETSRFFDAFHVTSYMETLLLLGRFDCISC